MSIALAQRLIASGAVSAADAEAALLSSLARRIPFVRALIDTGAIAEAVLEQEIEQLGGIGLRQVVGIPELVNRLPPHFCRRMGVLPVRVDHAARVVEVAAADPLDGHVAAEVSFHLGVPVRVLRAPMSSIEDAIRRIELEAEAAAGRTRRATPPFPHGAPESSNPPPPPPDPAPIPLVKKVKERPPDTLRLYKQTMRPGDEEPGLDIRETPRPPSDGAPPTDSSPRTLRGTAPSPQEAAPAPSIEAPPETQVPAMVSPDQVPAASAEPPAVSFPSMPPPSVLDEPALLAAEEPWLAPPPAPPPPAPEPRPEPPPPAPAPPPPRQRSRSSRFARPTIDIQIPLPPSERTRQKRPIWDVPIGGEAPGGAADEEEEEEEEEEDLYDLRPKPSTPLPVRPERFDLRPVLEALRVAGSRDDVVAAGLRGLRMVGRRAAIFVVRRDGFHGWACNVEFGDQQQLREVSVPHDAPSLFATAVAAGSYFGPIPSNAVHAGLLGVLEQPATDVAAAVVRAGGKPVMVLLADDLVDIKRLVLPRLLEVADAVGAALSRLLAARL